LKPNELFHRAKYGIKVLQRLQGGSERECPLCGFKGQFRAAGHPPRYDARCGKCGCYERHRLLALAQAQMEFFRKDDTLLHFAPEPALSAWIEARVGSYITADLRPGAAKIVLNMEQIDMPEGNVDVVYASHVLEHVDDRKALAEIYRILRPGGRLVAMVPMIEGWATTYENPAIKSPRERDLHFGQHDHVRYYGADFRDRLRTAGFALNEYCSSGPESVRYSLGRGDHVFVGTKH
jgi:SAM-dependent methyltransferase